MAIQPFGGEDGVDRVIEGSGRVGVASRGGVVDAPALAVVGPK